MVNGGPIGGTEQTGRWRIDARYNKDELIRRIEKVHLYRERIEIHNLDAIGFLRDVVSVKEELGSVLVYLDPPYYVKGRHLYLNHSEHQDHVRLAEFLKEEVTFRWLMTYDDAAQIRRLYQDCPCMPFQLSYTAHSRRRGKEVLISSPGVVLPYEASLI